jgi:hypothetical protein
MGGAAACPAPGGQPEASGMQQQPAPTAMAAAPKQRNTGRCENRAVTAPGVSGSLPAGCGIRKRVRESEKCFPPPPSMQATHAAPAAVCREALDRPPAKSQRRAADRSPSKDWVQQQGRERPDKGWGQKPGRREAKNEEGRLQEGKRMECARSERHKGERSRPEQQRPGLTPSEARCRDGQRQEGKQQEGRRQEHGRPQGMRQEGRQQQQQQQQRRNKPNKRQRAMKRLRKEESWRVQQQASDRLDAKQAKRAAWLQELRSRTDAERFARSSVRDKPHANRAGPSSQQAPRGCWQRLAAQQEGGQG